MSAEIAAVVPTRERETRLAFLLDALAEQTLPPERFEVVVVRDGDWAGPRTDAPKGLPVRFLQTPERRGPAAARNAGWLAAEAPVVAFTDDDCRPAPGWLEALLGAAEPGVFVQGRTEPDPDERHLIGGLALTQLIDAPSPAYETCNMAYRREDLERLDGFDQSFGFAAEDTDLALRAEEAGLRPAFARDALVWHAVQPRQLPGALRDSLRWQEVPALVARHPRHRHELPRRLFWRESHARVLLALLGLLLARRRPLLGLALAAPYLDLQRRGYAPGPRGWVRAALDLPARAAVDLAETAAVARGAVRHRTPLL